MIISLRTRAAALAVATSFVGISAGIANAAPATGSAYFTDRQDSFVHDKTSDTIGTVNMISCFIDNLNPEELVNRGNYAALVNEQNCDTRNRSDSSGSASATGAAVAPSYTRVVVNSARQFTTDAMRVKFWVDQKEGGVSSTIFANLNAAAAPGAANPYGSFRMDYAAPNPAGGALTMQGYIAGAASGVSFVEREARSSGGTNTRQLNLTRTTSDAGAGSISAADGGTTTTFQFAYNLTHFLRSSAGTDVCFDRRLSAASTSVWRYGLYDSDGNRVLRNSGFPISFTPPGTATTHHGYAGYHGVNFPPEAMTLLTNGSTVARQSFDAGGATTSYTVTRAGGRLLKLTRRTVTLAAFSNARFSFRPFNGLETATANAIVPGTDATTIRTRDLEAYWDQTAGVLKVSGVQTCGTSGCVVAALSAPVTLTAADATRYTTGLFGHSQTFGGPISIPAATMATVISGPATGSVHYRTQDIVYPGDAGAPTTLACVANCPNATDINGYFATTRTSTSPYGSTAGTFAGAASTVGYTFSGTTGLLSVTSGAAVVMPSSATEDSLRSTPFRQGLRSGKLVANAADLVCGGGGPTTYCEQRADELAEYYVWETGINAWNQFVGLRAAGALTFTRFDPPLALNYTVPAGAAYGEYASRNVILRYSGFGDLQGVPGHCVDGSTNAPVACGSGVRFVPQFSIPYTTAAGGTATDSAGATYYVKWLNREVRFGRDVTPGACSGLTVGSLSSLPVLTGLEDPSSTASAIYIGAKPTVTGTPRVVDGVTRY